MPTSALHTVFQALVVTKLTYCSCAWYGFCTAKERDRLESFLQRCKRRGYCADNTPTVEELCTASDTKLFQLVVADPQHTPQVHSYLHNLPSPTTWDLVLTVWHYQTNIVLSTVVILSLGCMPIVIDFVTVIPFFFRVMSEDADGGTTAAVPPPFRPGNPALCGSRPLVTPY